MREFAPARSDEPAGFDLRPFLGLAPGHAGFSRLDVEVAIDADADAATLREIHEQVVATSPVGHTLAHPVAVDVQLAGART